MYDGSTLCFLATALYKERAAGILLSILVFIEYRIALLFEEPFTHAIVSPFLALCSSMESQNLMMSAYPIPTVRQTRPGAQKAWYWRFTVKSCRTQKRSLGVVEMNPNEKSEPVAAQRWTLHDSSFSLKKGYPFSRNGAQEYPGRHKCNATTEKLNTPHGMHKCSFTLFDSLTAPLRPTLR